MIGRNNMTSSVDAHTLRRHKGLEHVKQDRPIFAHASACQQQTEQRIAWLAYPA